MYSQKQMGNSQARRISVSKNPVYQRLPLRKSAGKTVTTMLRPSAIRQTESVEAPEMQANALGAVLVGVGSVHCCLIRGFRSHRQSLLLALGKQLAAYSVYIVVHEWPDWAHLSFS